MSQREKKQNTHTVTFPPPALENKRRPCARDVDTKNSGGAVEMSEEKLWPLRPDWTSPGRYCLIFGEQSQFAAFVSRCSLVKGHA